MEIQKPRARIIRAITRATFTISDVQTSRFPPMSIVLGYAPPAHTT